MKLLTQSDDYGFTRGVTCGILDAIENGVVRNTGLFVNMPESEHAASFIQDYPQVCFGIDFNIVSGDPVSDPELLPDLVDQDGHFIRSTVKMADPRFGKEELWPYEQVLTELRAQLKHFVRLAGQPPEICTDTPSAAAARPISGRSGPCRKKAAFRTAQTATKR